MSYAAPSVSYFSKLIALQSAPENELSPPRREWPPALRCYERQPKHTPCGDGRIRGLAGQVAVNRRVERLAAGGEAQRAR